MTNQLPSLTHIDIRNWVGAASFQKGQSYFASKAIFDTRRQGLALKAQCHGSQSAAYRLQATLGAKS